jgi:hypothetical protein
MNVMEMMAHNLIKNLKRDQEPIILEYFWTSNPIPRWIGINPQQSPKIE